MNGKQTQWICFRWNLHHATDAPERTASIRMDGVLEEEDTMLIALHPSILHIRISLVITMRDISGQRMMGVMGVTDLMVMNLRKGHRMKIVTPRRVETKVRSPMIPILLPM